MLYVADTFFAMMSTGQADFFARIFCSPPAMSYNEFALSLIEKNKTAVILRKISKIHTVEV